MAQLAMQPVLLNMSPSSRIPSDMISIPFKTFQRKASTVAVHHKTLYLVRLQIE